MVAAHLSKLVESQKTALEQCVRQFEESWFQGNSPKIEDYLPIDPILRLAVLIELVHAEVEFRQRAGLTVNVEEYPKRFPELTAESGALSNLGSRSALSPSDFPKDHQARLRSSHDGPIDLQTHKSTVTGRSEHDTRVSDSVPAPRRIGGYEILDEIARGGMGIVYRAVQLGLKRHVAVKMILGGDLVDAERLARFRQEAEVLARISDPHIVQIYEIGEHAGSLFFSMELIDGGSLADLLKQGPLPPRKAAELIAVLARALESAHRLEIVHRDLKPANVLLMLDGTAKISDFGLAKQLDSLHGQTVTGEIMGSPAYMAPEQAQGRVEAIGPSTDIYALGAILYEVMTGIPVFRGATVQQVIQQVIQSEPVNPRTFDAAIPKDLETIALKCLSKDIPRRYSRAIELAEEIDRWLRGEPIQARPVGKAERLIRWSRRNRTVALLAVSVALALLLGTIVSTAFAINSARHAASAEANSKRAQDKEKEARANADVALINAKEARKNAELAKLQRDRADAQAKLAKAGEALARSRETDARWNAYVLGMNTGFQAWESTATERAHDLLAHFIPEPGQADLRGPEWYLLWSLLHDETATLAGHRRIVNSVDWSHDGKMIVSGSDDQTVIVWDAERHAARQTLRDHAGAVKAVAFSPDGRWLITASSDGTLQVRDGKSLALRKTIPIGPNGDVKLAFSPDSRLLVVGIQGGAGTVVLETSSWREWRHISSYSTRAVAFSPDSQLVATSDDGADVRVFDVDSSRQLALLSGFHFSLLFSHDGRRLISGQHYVPHDHKLEERGWASSEEYRLGGPERGDINQLARSPDQAWLALAQGYSTPYGTLEIWDARAGRELCSLEGHRGSVRSVAFAPDSRRLVSGGADGTVRIWDLTRQIRQASPVQHHSRVVGTAHSANGRWIATASLDKQVILWEASSGKPVWHSTLPGSAFAVAFSPDNQNLAMVFSGVVEDGLRILNVQTREFKAIAFSPGNATSVAYSPDGKLLAVGGGTAGTIQLIDPETGQLRRALKIHDTRTMSLCFSPDGKFIATGSDDQTACLVDISTGQVRSQFSGHAAAIYSVAFSRDQRLLATASLDGTARVWETNGGRHLATCTLTPGPAGLVAYGVAFRPEGTSLLVGFRLHQNNGRGAIAEFDARDFKLQRDWKRLGALGTLSMSPDGRRICLGLQDGRALVWDARTMTQTAELGDDTVRHAVAMSPTGRQVAVSRGRKVVVSDAETGVEQYILRARELPVACLAFSPDGRFLVGSEGDLSAPATKGELQVWNASTGTPAAQLPIESRSHKLAFSPDGQKLASATAAHQSMGVTWVDLWDVPTWRKANQLSHPVPHVGLGAMLFLPDSNRLLLGRADYFDQQPGELILWDTRSAQQVFRFPAHTLSISAAVALPDDQVLTAGRDSSLRVWDMKTGTLARSVALRTDPVTLALLPEERVAIGGSDGKIRIWSTATWQELAVFGAHPQAVNGLATSLNSRLLVSISAGFLGSDGGERFWRFAKPEDVQRLTIAAKPLLQTTGPNLTKGPDVTARLVLGLEQARERGEIDLPTFFLASRILRTEELEQGAFGRDCLNLIQSASEGALPWPKLKERLAAIEQPEARLAAARQQQLDKLGLERKGLIQELLTVARANDKLSQSRVALSALEHLLHLVPDHAEARQLRDKIEAYSPRQTVVDKLGIKLVELRPGRFLMGSPLDETGRDATENQHPVRLTKTVFMASQEVTRGQFANFVKATAYVTDAERESQTPQPTARSWKQPGFDQDDSHPAVFVSWNDATAFCQWISKQEGKDYRLPTEAEFEYACRAGTVTAYGWGEVPEQGVKWANVGDAAAAQLLKIPGLFQFNDAAVQTSSAGKYRANSWGLFDLTGNVREWCGDYSGAYPTLISDDPIGASSGLNRIIRGGSWRSPPKRCRSAARDRAMPETFADDLGFRVVRYAK